MTRAEETSTARSASPTLTIDWEAYAALLEEGEHSEAEARELIETLWSIVVAFVDLGFGIHPVQQACGEGSENAESLTPDVLSSFLNSAKQEQQETAATEEDHPRDAGERSPS
ncbi:hypothetical protein SAMN05421688_1510 [Poseidonocella pacifica]|uniref:Uncharacterized protein n=1 Tax=Poseidonocella pacifica TaxID=871651 RepID=A0A1I0WKC4_9RHOB|nr:hypothetical protein [Poseidonocella pacifica]SFA89004.1 hypothetical protein SAMN05421688_1510 [Poseidonocella pacifica]